MEKFWSPAELNELAVICNLDLKNISREALMKMLKGLKGHPFDRIYDKANLIEEGAGDALKRKIQCQDDKGSVAVKNYYSPGMKYKMFSTN